ncbi:MAG: D-alanyl-D-alanine carboxypeptidase, partial [Clostridia bacterium]|nr:D-alanyl-D-alanine carboxypeptidase [Clostridia bacterium]
MKRLISLCCAFFIAFSVTAVNAEGINTSAKSVLLMEQSTKEVLYENNADEKLPIASVTKIMTMLLIMEAIDSGKISMEDTVTVSERAMSMGGSTMFLEAG